MLFLNSFSICSAYALPTRNLRFLNIVVRNDLCTSQFYTVKEFLTRIIPFMGGV
jgi:hypothetical protein